MAKASPSISSSSTSSGYHRGLGSSFLYRQCQPETKVMPLGDSLLTNNIEPSCSIAHSEKARRELELSPIVFLAPRQSPLLTKVEDAVYVLLGHALVFDVEEPQGLVLV
jgi:hypothetical protein